MPSYHDKEVFLLLKSGNIEQYKQLTQFRDIKDFNNHIEQWMIDIKKEFTKSELIALKRLIRFSASIAGVCYAKIQTIVAATHQYDGLGISRSTFKRMIKKAVNLKLITIYSTYKNRKQSHNVYVFNRYQSNLAKNNSFSCTIEPPNNKKLNQPNNKTNNLYKTNNLLKINKRYDEELLDASFTNSRVPTKFVNYICKFYNSAKIIEELWKCVSIQTRYLNYYTDSERIKLGIKAFKQLFRVIKSKRNIRSIYGYYYGIISNLLDQEYQDILLEMIEQAS